MLDIEKMDAEEREVAEAAQSAFLAARERHLAAGDEVLEVEGDAVVCVKPDGRREFVERIPAPRAVVPGTKIQLR